jgi:methyl-accepting chemotaxis protein
MNRNWTFGQKIAAALAVVVVLAVTVAAVAVYALRSVVSVKDHVITVNAQNLVDAERLHALREKNSAAVRGYLFAREGVYLEAIRAARADSAAVLARLRKSVFTDEGRQLLDQIERADLEHQAAVDQVVALRQTSAQQDSLVRAYEEQVAPKRDALNRQIDAFISLENRLLEDGRRASSDRATSAIALVVVLGIAGILVAFIVSFVLTRSLGFQIAGAVGKVQSSSAELQAAAGQQATGTREQVTSMNEITTTLSELLATSRQIAEGAQHVAQIAGQTATSARAGQGTVDKGHESIGALGRQIDLIVSHMLDLGKKSQQIGSVLDIVGEVAEQTNILSINATIEAAGAGEAGKRFAVVADEIRKLAERVSGSTKEIRDLIESIRSSANTAVMATEGGAKAVDTGAKQFAEVAAAFTQIAGLVQTTTEAAREIELSTKQQSTAVEQVKEAAMSVSQAAKESEASASQTLQTAGALTELSRNLLRIIKPQASA